MNEKTIVAVTAICAITAIEVVALCNGINGTVLALTLAAIAGLGGYEVGFVRGAEPVSHTTEWEAK